MVVASSYWGRRALDFVDAVESADTVTDVTQLFEKVISELGFHAYIMAGIPTRPRSFEEVTLANGWPTEWFKIYARENLVTVDPIPRYALSSINPFTWSEAPYDRENDVGARRVMERALDFKFHDGFCIPIHYDDSAAAISVAGERPDLDQEPKRALHLMGMMTHGKLRSLTRPVALPKLLTPKEAEALKWAAMGKTSWETSMIMGIPDRNVRFYLEQAQRKLCTANKVATVARALVNGEIRL